MSDNSTTVSPPTKASKVLKHSTESEWLTENKDAIDDYNEPVAKHGCFGDEFRRF